MRTRLVVTVLGAALLTGFAANQPARRLNPLVELLEQKKPVFGLYAPANRRPPRPGTPAAAATTANAEPVKTAAQLAAEALGHKTTDYIFDGSMEGDFERGYSSFVEFAKGMADGGVLTKSPSPRLSHPLVLKTPEVAPDLAKAAERIGRQLNLGASAIVFVSVESAAELQAGVAAMRFKGNGGTRPDAVGGAPAFWGLSEGDYKAKADLWPLNPKGELVAWAIVESKEGLARVREIAAVKGISALFPGAGTLRGVFTTTDASGQRVFDEKGWEAAIQQVLAACKEFNVPCGYPAGPNDIEARMKQGFSVFVIGWGEPGFKAVAIGRAVAGR